LPRYEHVKDSTITRILQDSILMKEAIADQCRHAVEVARANGWTYERIMETTGYGYTAIRGLDPRLKDEVDS
jgi:hypothetical protein